MPVRNRLGAGRRASVIVTAAAVLSLHGEDSTGTTPTTITPDALRAFLDSQAQRSVSPPAQPSATRIPLPQFEAQNPPEFASPAVHHDASDYGGFDDIRLDWTVGASRYTLDSGRSRITTDGRFTTSGRASAAWMEFARIAGHRRIPPRPFLCRSVVAQHRCDVTPVTSLVLGGYPCRRRPSVGPACPNRVGALSRMHRRHMETSIMRSSCGGQEWTGDYAPLRSILVIPGRSAGSPSAISATRPACHASDGTRFGIRASGLCYGGTIGVPVLKPQ